MSPAPSAILAVTYAAPGRLWILLVVAVLVAGYVAVQLRKPKYTVKFTNLELLQSVAPSRPGWKRHAAAVAFVARARRAGAGARHAAAAHQGARPTGPP